MLQRDIPDWESFKFGISCLDTALVFMVKLRKAGGHFSASGSWSSDDNQWSCCFDIIVLAISLITYNKGSIIRITRDQIKHIYFDSKLLQTFLKRICAFLSGILGDADTSDIESALGKYFHKAEYIFIISDTQVTSDFIFINISSADYNNDLCLIRKLHQHTQFAVRLKSRKNSGSMVVIKKLAAKFQIKFVSKLVNTFPNMFGLHFQILVVVKSYLHLFISFPHHIFSTAHLEYPGTYSANLCGQHKFCVLRGALPGTK